MLPPPPAAASALSSASAALPASVFALPQDTVLPAPVAAGALPQCTAMPMHAVADAAPQAEAVGASPGVPAHGLAAEPAAGHIAAGALPASNPKWGPSSAGASSDAMGEINSGVGRVGGACADPHRPPRDRPGSAPALPRGGSPKPLPDSESGAAVPRVDAPAAAAAADSAWRPKLSVFKGMSKAAAAAAGKLADAGGDKVSGAKPRTSSAGKGSNPNTEPKGSKPDPAPGAADDGERAAAGRGAAEEAGGVGPGEAAAAPEESDAVKAERSWAAATGGGSLIHDLFRGQLQSTVECQACKRRSTQCAPCPASGLAPASLALSCIGCVSA